MNLNRGEEAAKFGKWAFEKYREQLGENHPDTILALNNLVIVLGNLERYEEALEFSQLLCAKRREQFGEDHQKTISALGDLSRIFDELGQYSDALEVNKRLLENKRRTLGEDHPETIHMLNTLAWSYHQCGDPIPGVQLIERACQLAHENNSISTEEIISYEDTRAVLYADVGRLEEAYTLELSLIKKVQNEFAESKPLLAGCNFSAAYICEKKQDHVSALPYAEKAYPLFLEIFGQESKTTNECERMLDRIKVNVQSITSEI